MELFTQELGKYVWDKGRDSVKGLCVRARLNEDKAIVHSFYFYYVTKDGIQRRPKIGDFGRELNLTQARAVAKQWAAKVALGEDPSLERQLKRKETTVNALFQKCYDQYWKNNKSGWGVEAARIYEKHIKEPFGNYKITGVRPGMVREWMDSMAETPIQANRSLRVLSKMFNYAESRELIRLGQNPCRIVESFKENKRDRFATPHELKALSDVLERQAKSYPKQVAFIYLLMFTGARPSSIERAKWEDLTITSNGVGLLKLDGKTGKDTVVVPLPAMRILEKLNRYHPEILGIKLPHGFWKTTAKEAGCPDLWARDLRRTFATIGLSHGQGIGVIGELLNHKSTETTKIYAKLIDTARVTAASEIASTIESIIKSDQSSCSEGESRPQDPSGSEVA